MINSDINAQELQDGRGRSASSGIGFAGFLVPAGVVLLDEKVGSWPGQVDWLFLVILIAGGPCGLWQRVRGS